MGESKKKSSSPSKAENPAPESVPPLGDILSHEEMESLSALQLVDLIAGKLPPHHTSLMDLIYLRERISAIEEMNDQARQALEKLDEIVEKLRSPAFRVGTFLMAVENDKAHVCLGGTDYVCRVDPKIPLNSLQMGQRVLCNEAFAVVQGLGFDKNGPIVRIDELLSDGRLRIGQEAGMTSLVLLRSALLVKEKLKPGMEVRLDVNQRVALEVIGMGKRIERSLESVTELPWSSIGGQADAVQAIRDTIELPFLHRDLFKRFEHTVPKGFLLYGPPGCGKTLLGKATAYNLRQQIKAQTGVDHPEFFLHVKGPEILNMWVGESERQVRDLFTQCRERAKDGALAFLFIDEAESILGTRRSGRFNSILSTLVPMFCTEMDGIEPLQNVVVILASNRADLIDPAILRPGRIDRKIRVKRPDQIGAKAIYEIYLKESLPLAEPRTELAQAVADAHYARTPENQFLEIVYRSGKKDFLYRGDLASGAIIAAIVERAKSFAIKRTIETGQETHLQRADLLLALQREYEENDLFPPTDVTEDWLKLTDFDPENVIKLGPVRPVRKDATHSGVV
ncbi:MAG TPA: AAA family ATPase [Verrucomicrobiae bacterium]|jgi:proteasome-associated ATPase|nr:AAA family ATPase [Verrucomicrobiae bacterium]